MWTPFLSENTALFVAVARFVLENKTGLKYVHTDRTYDSFTFNSSIQLSSFVSVLIFMRQLNDLKSM